MTVYQVMADNAAIATLVVPPTPAPTMSYYDTTIPFSSFTGGFTNYTVIAGNTYGTTSSNTITEKVFKASVPNPIQVTPDAEPKTQWLVTWNQGSAGTFGLNGYRVLKSLAGVPTPNVPSAITPLVVAVVPTTTPTLVVVDTGVSNAHGWFYWVEPYDSLPRGGDIAVALTPSLKLAPQPPVNVTAVGPVGNNGVTVSWNDGGASYPESPVL